MKKAFTLIELLVVIAIISILAAILFPVFAQAKEAAKRTHCMAHCKQIGTGLYLYLNDYDDCLPMSDYGSDSPNPPNTTPPYTAFSWHKGPGVSIPNWADVVQPYAKSYDIFGCMSDDGGPTYTNNGPTGVPVSGVKLSYALNFYMFRPLDGTSLLQKGVEMSSIVTPASKIFIAEVGLIPSTKARNENVRPDRNAGFKRHNGGSVYIYADTHAKYHKMPPYWAATPVPSNLWSNSALADTQPCAQWFPWKDAPEQW